jgi:NAD-dependent deacetylase
MALNGDFPSAFFVFAYIMVSMDSPRESLISALKKAKRLVFLGGAGVSTDSGIPDFRSPQGIYNVKSKYGVPYEVMLSHSYFASHTPTFYDFYWSTMVYASAKPCLAHKALAEYEKKGHRVAILTQNIDGLHQEAGSRLVYELHGSTRRYHCLDCGKKFALKDLKHAGVPHCPECGGLIKPEVVLYEEPLDETVLLSAANEMKYGDFLIVGGTSLNVYPAAGLIDYFGGGPRVIINKEATGVDSLFDVVIHEDLGKVLSEILL